MLDLIIIAIIMFWFYRTAINHHEKKGWLWVIIGALSFIVPVLLSKYLFLPIIFENFLSNYNSSFLLIIGTIFNLAIGITSSFLTRLLLLKKINKKQTPILSKIWKGWIGENCFLNINDNMNMITLKDTKLANGASMIIIGKIGNMPFKKYIREEIPINDKKFDYLFKDSDNTTINVSGELTNQSTIKVYIKIKNNDNEIEYENNLIKEEKTITI